MCLPLVYILFCLIIVHCCSFYTCNKLAFCSTSFLIHYVSFFFISIMAALWPTACACIMFAFVYECILWVLHYKCISPPTCIFLHPTEFFNICLCCIVTNNCIRIHSCAWRFNCILHRCILALFALVLIIVIVLVLDCVVSWLDMGPTDCVARTVWGARDSAHLFEQRFKVSLVKAEVKEMNEAARLAHAVKCSADRGIKAPDVTALAVKMACPQEQNTKEKRLKWMLKSL